MNISVKSTFSPYFKLLVFLRFMWNQTKLLVFSLHFLKIWWVNIVCTSLSRVKYTLERSQFGPVHLTDNIFGVTFILSNDLSEINSKQTDDNNQENEDLLIHDKKLRKLRNVTIL